MGFSVKGQREVEGGLRRAAELMVLSARTAPKSAGKDFVAVKVLEGEAVSQLAEAMLQFGRETGKKDFDRDARNVGLSPLVLLVGLKDAQPVGLNCGACGFEACKDVLTEEKTEFRGPLCAFRQLDLGIAIGSAVKTASLFNVDNRIMYRIGVVARKKGFCDFDFVMGIPLSAYGKNIYFDR